MMSNRTSKEHMFITIIFFYQVRERRQLGFVTLKGNLAVNLKPTDPLLLNGKGQFTFLKTKSSHSSGIITYPPKFEFIRN